MSGVTPSAQTQVGEVDPPLVEPAGSTNERTTLLVPPARSSDYSSGGDNYCRFLCSDGLCVALFYILVILIGGVFILPAILCNEKAEAAKQRRDSRSAALWRGAAYAIIAVGIGTAIVGALFLTGLVFPGVRKE